MIVSFWRILLKNSLSSLILYFHDIGCAVGELCEGPHRLSLKQRGARVMHLPIFSFFNPQRRFCRALVNNPSTFCRERLY
jgi:hypothetical protein